MVPEGSKEEIADKNITCYKVLKVAKGWFRFLYFKAQYRKFRYWFWYENFPCKKVKLKQITLPGFHTQIHKGYHSYRHPVTTAELWENNFVLVEFIIPKGTKYFKNEMEYVSESIKLKHSIKGNELQNKIKEHLRMKEELESPQKN